MDDLIEELRNSISLKNKDTLKTAEDYLSMGSDYTPLRIDESNFHTIDILKEKEQYNNKGDKEGDTGIDDKEAKSILFIDGGSTILFETAGFCLGFIRVCGSIYKNNKNIIRKKNEFYIIVRENIVMEKEGTFNIKIFPHNPDLNYYNLINKENSKNNSKNNSENNSKNNSKSVFDSVYNDSKNNIVLNNNSLKKQCSDFKFNNTDFEIDEEILNNKFEKSKLSRIVSMLRRIIELDFANNIYLNNPAKIDYILIDGTLESRNAYETECLNVLLKSGKVCALSKTCTLTTKQGIPITKKLYDLKKGSWYYHPIIINNNHNHNANIYFIKLNDKSKHVFRFEIQKGFFGDVDELFRTLSKNANDPIFLGYPYGFIDADLNARISEEEKKSLQTMISVKLGKDWIEFSKSLNSLNAHEILDKIRF